MNAAFVAAALPAVFTEVEKCEDEKALFDKRAERMAINEVFLLGKYIQVNI